MTISDIPTQQIKYLNELFKIAEKTNKKKVLIKIREGATPAGEDYELYNWLNYKQVSHKIKEPIYTAGTLQNEILFDLDISDWQLMRHEMNKVIIFLKKEKIPYQLAYSGGKSVHLHIFIGTIFFDAEIIDNKNTFDFDIFKTVRTELMNIIFKESGANRAIIGLDLPKITFSKYKKGSMVRFYGTTRDDGHFKTLIPTIPDTKEEAQKLSLVFPDRIEVWNVPEKFSKIVNESIKLNISRAKEDNHVKFENMILDGTVLKKFPCMKEILGKDGILAKDGQRYYTGQAIMLLGKKCGKSYTECSDILNEYYKKVQKYDPTFTDDKIKLRIDNLRTEYESNDQFSCRKFKEKVSFGINVCNYLKCPIKKHVDRTIKKDEQKATTAETIDIPQEKLTWIKQEADRMLNEGTAFDFIMKTYNTLHVGDVNTGKLMLGSIGAQCCINTQGIQLNVAANSGMGKSHAAKVIFGHLTHKDWVIESGFSPKVLFRMKNLKAGTVLYIDDESPNEDMQQVIKKSSTNYQSETRYTFLDNANEVVSGVIPPRIMWVLTSVNGNGGIEYLNRQLNISVDESDKQDENVHAQQLKDLKSGKIHLKVTDDVLICREIIRDIKEHKLFYVVVPYADDIVWNLDKHNRRNFVQFSDLIMAFAVFNYRKRNKCIVDGMEAIEATEADFDDAVEMYGERAVNQKLKLTNNQIEKLKLMERDKPYPADKLKGLFKITQGALSNLMNGKSGHPEDGLLYKVPELSSQQETDFIGEKEISDDKWETERTIVKKTKPRTIYTLFVDFNSITSFGKVAILKNRKGK